MDEAIVTVPRVDPAAIARLETVGRLNRDLKKAAVTMTRAEARWFVSTYYAMQEGRIRENARVKKLTKEREPHAALDWMAEQFETMERNCRDALESWASKDAMGQWAMGIFGIGGVIASGLSAHIDMEKAPTVGHIWSFAGLNPRVKWEKGEKRPWNADLKVLCWKIGESFVKVSGRPNSFYGKIYAERKAYEVKRNDDGLNAKTATEIVASGKYKRKTVAREAYKAGRLPDAHVHARAKRFAVKLFLSHWHAVACERVLHKPAPMPYVIQHLGHAHIITVEDAMKYEAGDHQGG
jgi:hypothetical protein